MQMRVAMLAALALPLMNCPSQDCVEGQFEPRMHHDHFSVGARTLCSTVFVPDDYDPSQEWPLLLYLHGFEQAGLDGLEPLDQGLGPVLRNQPELYPCIVVIPQLPRVLENTIEANAIFTAAIEDVIAEYSIDLNRLYVTGASTGSTRAFLYVAMTPDVFAALMPFAGPVNVAWAPLLTDIPILMYNGTDDPLSSIDRARALRNAILQMGGDVELRQFPGADHEIFYQAYSNPATLEWLFSKTLN